MHIPVLLNETIDGLNLKEGEILFDATFGLGGHSFEACKRVKNLKVIANDLNDETLQKAGKALKEKGCQISLHNENFRKLDKVLSNESLEKVDKFIFDLGWSSELLEESKRGFSFKRNEPLLMTYQGNPGESDLTAKDIVNDWQVDNIELILRNYADERYASRIAKAIEVARRRKPIETTFDLVEVIRNSVPVWYKSRRTHFATKTFQALRIAVNDEIDSLKEALEKAYAHLNPKGRLAVISFHSLEDRIVKNYFKRLKQEGAEIITKKAIEPRREEVKENPRSRSAKLRIIEKI
jgi:16S rRNA (cytosine1402-N4)-methyltransferase